MKAEIFTRDRCDYCTKAKQLLLDAGIPFEVYNCTSKTDPNFVEMKKRFPEAQTFPQIWIEGVHIGGHDDLVNWFKESLL